MTASTPISPPAPSLPVRAGLFALLALVMLATRVNHFGALPDASWAVFFAAGFYLRGQARWAFPALLALGVAIDYAVISGQGIAFWSHYCMSPAYWFLIPAYGAMWLGGAWLRRQYAGLHLRELGLLVAAAVISVSVCYLITNGSFYGLSANVPARSFAGWIKNFGDWYLIYMRTTLIYVGVGAALHVLAVHALAWLPGAQTSSARR
jgi:hypothetical protein